LYWLERTVDFYRLAREKWGLMGAFDVLGAGFGKHLQK